MNFRYRPTASLLRAFAGVRRRSMLPLALALITGSSLTFALPKQHDDTSASQAAPSAQQNAEASAVIGTVSKTDGMEQLIQELNRTDLIPADAAIADSVDTQDRLLPFITSRLALGLDVTTAAQPEENANGKATEASLFTPAERVFNTALDMLGTRYVWGGNSKQQGFDCSGLVKAVYRRALAVDLPRSAHAQANSSKLIPISRQELVAGDLVFFNTRGKTYSHVGVYLGDRQFMHAPRRGKNVRIDSMGKSYWSKRFTGARRAITATPPQAETGSGNAGKTTSGDRS